MYYISIYMLYHFTFLASFIAQFQIYSFLWRDGENDLLFPLSAPLQSLFPPAPVPALSFHGSCTLLCFSALFFPPGFRARSLSSFFPMSL